MMIKNSLFLLFFTLCTLPGLQADTLAERVALLEQTVLTQGQRITALTQNMTQKAVQPISFSHIRSLYDFGTWTCENKATLAKGALIFLGACTLKRYFKPEPSTQNNALINQLQQQIPGVQITLPTQNETNNTNRDNIIGKTIDRIGDFGMYLAGSTYSLANRALWAVTLRTTN